MLKNPFLFWPFLGLKSGQIRAASRRNVKNYEKLGKTLFFFIKTFVRELAPIRMIHKNTKKNLK